MEEKCGYQKVCYLDALASFDGYYITNQSLAGIETNKEQGCMFIQYLLRPVLVFQSCVTFPEPCHARPCDQLSCFIAPCCSTLLSCRSLMLIKAKYAHRVTG